MKKLLFFNMIILFGFHSITYSQNYKRNNNWITGFAPVVKFAFSPSFVIDTFSNSYFTTCSSSISDTNGDYQFYCTGYFMMDKLGDIMENGDNINCPKGHILSDYYGGSSLFDQTSIILPKKDNTYYVFCTGMSDSVALNYLNHIYTEFDVLNYSVVDMDSNAGKGKVTVKNKILTENQHYVNCALTAVRHGNGKDWWLVKSDCWNHRLQLFLVQEDTILGPHYVDITDTGDYCVFDSQLYFSDDGTKFASSMYGNWIDSAGFYTYNLNRVDVYDFDRCDGNFTYRNQYVVPFDSTTYTEDDYKMGICFSPNGKLIYMSARYSIYQIDVEDTSTTNGIYITGPDTVLANFPRYSLMACGPDGKLYIGNRNGTRPFMSYIDKPNIRGLGCDFMANGLWQPYTNLLSPPNMPNYGLGAAPVGGNCWPLSSNEITDRSSDLVVYPNPISTLLFIKTSLKNKRELYNALGQLIINTDKNEIDVRTLSKGLYYLKVGNEVRKILIE